MGCSCFSKPKKKAEPPPGLDRKSYNNRSNRSFHVAPKVSVTKHYSCPVSSSQDIFVAQKTYPIRKDNETTQVVRRRSTKKNLKPDVISCEHIQYFGNLIDFIDKNNQPEDGLMVPYLLYYCVKELEQAIRSYRSFRRTAEWVTTGKRNSHLATEGLYRKTGTKSTYTYLTNQILSNEFRYTSVKVQELIRDQKNNPTNITSMIKVFFGSCLSEPLLTHKLLPHFILIIDPDIVNPKITTPTPIQNSTSSDSSSSSPTSRLSAKLKSRSFSRFDFHNRPFTDESESDKTNSDSEKNSVDTLLEPYKPKAKATKSLAELYKDDSRKQEKLKKLVYALPLANQHTLALIILHFQHVVHNTKNKMNDDSLSISVAPSIIGDLDPYLLDMYKKRYRMQNHENPLLALSDCLKRAYSCQSSILKALLAMDKQFYMSLFPEKLNRSKW